MQLPHSCLYLSTAPVLLCLVLWLRRGLLNRRQRHIRRRRVDAHVRETPLPGQVLDTLLQSMQGLILKAHGVATRMSPGDPRRGMLDEILSQAEAVVADGARAMETLRDSGATSRWTVAPRTAGQAHAEGHLAATSVMLRGTPRALASGVAAELYALGRRFIRTGCTEEEQSGASFRVAYLSGALEVTIHCPGMATDDAGVAPLFAHCQDCAARLDGMAAMFARAGGGTIWLVTIPACRAYRSRKDRRRLR